MLPYLTANADPVIIIRYDIVIGAPGCISRNFSATQDGLRECAGGSTDWNLSCVICKSELEYDHHSLGDTSKIRGGYQIK